MHGEDAMKHMLLTGVHLAKRACPPRRTDHHRCNSLHISVQSSQTPSSQGEPEAVAVAVDLTGRFERGGRLRTKKSCSNPGTFTSLPFLLGRRVYVLVVIVTLSPRLPWLECGDENSLNERQSLPPWVKRTGRNVY